MTDKKLLTAQTKTPEKKGYLGTIVLFIIGILIGAGGVSFFSASNDTNEQVNYEQEITENASDDALSSTGNRTPVELGTTASSQIVIPDQEAGGHVTIQQVTFDAPGWVVVHELSQEGTLGNALGAARFDAGTYSGVVQLLRVTESGNDYAAVLYRDNGDRRFDLDLDNPVRDEEQNVVSTQFSII